MIGPSRLTLWMARRAVAAAAVVEAVELTRRSAAAGPVTGTNAAVLQGRGARKEKRQ